MIYNVERNLVQYAKEQSKPDTVFKIVAAGVISLFFYISLSVLQEEISTLLVIVLLFGRLWPLFTAFQKNTQVFLSDLPVYELIVNMLDEIPAHIPDEKNELVFDETLEMDRVRYAYDPDSTGIDVSLTVKAGQMIAIMGASGDGQEYST